MLTIVSKLNIKNRLKRNLKSAGLTQGGLGSPRGIKLGGQFGGKPGLKPCRQTTYINSMTAVSNN